MVEQTTWLVWGGEAEEESAGVEPAVLFSSIRIQPQQLNTKQQSSIHLQNQHPHTPKHKSTPPTTHKQEQLTTSAPAPPLITSLHSPQQQQQPPGSEAKTNTDGGSKECDPAGLSCACCSLSPTQTDRTQQRDGRPRSPTTAPAAGRNGRRWWGSRPGMYAPSINR